MPRAKPKKGTFPRILKWIFGFVFLFFGVSVLEVTVLSVVDPRFTAMSAWQWICHAAGGEEDVPRMKWRPIEKISPHVGRAVLAGEDQRFLSHWGFDFTEIGEAMKDMASRRGFRGASTISMQTARTVFLWPSRSLLRKGLEAYYTLLIELFWGKERILEVYLNTVDWGEGIMGIEMASQHYFHVSSAQLSPREAAILAAVLPNPHRWSPIDPGPYTLKRQERILKDMMVMPLVARRKGKANR